MSKRGDLALNRVEDDVAGLGVAIEAIVEKRRNTNWGFWFFGLVGNS